MKLFLWGLVLSLCMAASTAEAAKVRYEGSFIIKQKSGTCSDYNPVGGNGRVNFEPQVAGSDNGPGSELFLYGGIHGTSFDLENGLFNTNFKEVAWHSVSHSVFTDPAIIVRVRFKSQKPATIKAGTNFITAVAEVENYDFQVGCTVTVHLALIKRLNN